ncbi:hypothetical protein [Knoellia sp. LjRoot47]|uniref:hypothetical protein n=1 Tax=Knoellia sp. LjRoot47 TaxID=3342330 RepID=UPI003ECD1BAD
MRTRPSRWWIAGVPFAVAAMLAASGYRVPVFWYQSGQHHEIADGDAQEWVDVAEQTSDAHGDFTRRYSVRLAGLGGESTAYEARSDEFTLADGMVARQVRLDFRADPSQPLMHCALTLVDDEGREYRVGHPFDEIGESIANCVPEETPGPSMPVLTAQKRGVLPEKELPRPSEWSVTPAIAVPKNATFVALRISFENPDYVTLRLPR